MIFGYSSSRRGLWALAALAALHAQAAQDIDASGTAWAGASVTAPPLRWLGEREGLRALEFEGPLYRGRETRVYALYGAPTGAEGPLPAIVLVHGGAGRVFPEWVRHWVGRGYAALALDIGGLDAPKGFEGPRGYGGYNQIAEPLVDQWAYHAVANVVRAHSLLREFPEVDKERTFVYGVSWGGFLTQIAVSLDHRFRAATAVYACGFRVEDDELLRRFAHMSEEERRRWTHYWDSASHLPRCTTPLFFVNGTEDRIFRLKPYHATYRLTREDRRTIKLSVGLSHGQQAATSIPEVERFFDSFAFAERPPLLRLGAVEVREGRAAAQATGSAKIVSACWWSTQSPGPYHRDESSARDLKESSSFRPVSASWSPDGLLRVEVAVGTRVGFFEVTDEYGAKTTSELLFLP